MSLEMRATYRLQLQPGFGFDEAAAIAEYLAALGISHVYTSPLLQAAPGSTHGYDVVDHSRVSQELGGPAAHARFREALRRLSLSQLVDVVANHMALGPRNPWWWDVLENGPASRYASYFDLDWEPPEPRLRDRILLPILEDPYGRALEAGDIRVERSGGAFTIRYRTQVVPLAPRSLGEIIGAAARACASDELAFIADSFSTLPPPTATDRPSVERRHRDKEVLRRLLARLCAEQPDVAGAIDRRVAEINRDADALDALLHTQTTRLAYWRVATQELGYRRFFDVSSLIGLRMEDERVFRETHALPIAWVNDTLGAGLRIDHPDGLRDPEQYFERLAAACPGAWIIAEKILGPNESLPRGWPVHGTTGYDFLNRATGLFVDPEGEKGLTSFYRAFTGESRDFATAARAAKHQVLRESFGSETSRLAALFLEICEAHRRFRDYTRRDAHAAMCDVLASFPVYRTYVRPPVDGEPVAVSNDDAAVIADATEAAKAHRHENGGDLLDFLRDILLLRVRGALESELVWRFQQLSAAVMAKGFEDTALYVWNRFVALNEVGGAPERFGVSVDEFHLACAQTLRLWPRTLLATSTHDTKRSEDVRMRLALLAEIPARWADAVKRWSELNARHWGGSTPDRNFEYLFYQTLVGAWPIGADRLLPYMEKAMREAKSHTSWVEPHPEYEKAALGFASGALGHAKFMEDVESFVRPLIAPGRVSSLALTLLKLTVPGVPDIYQGTELWDLSLVDPDNRRPVDFAARRRLLALLESLAPEAIWARADEGLPKLAVVRAALALRRRRVEAFGTAPAGMYRPLLARGRAAKHVVAFARGERVVVVVPRLVLGLEAHREESGSPHAATAWGDTSLDLPPGPWWSVFGRERIEDGPVTVRQLLRRFPVCLLSRGEDQRTD